MCSNLFLAGYKSTMATPAEQVAKLLDFNQELDITLLDSVVECMYSGSGEMVSSVMNISLITNTALN